MHVTGLLRGNTAHVVTLVNVNPSILVQDIDEPELFRPFCS